MVTGISGGHSANVEITWLGHSTAVLDIDAGGRHTRLVTDPLLQRHAGMLRRRGERPGEQWRDADAVLLSHLHHDHAELGSLRMLDGAPVLTAPANARWIRAKGLDGVGIGQEWIDAGGVRVRMVPAVHGARPMPHRPNAAGGHLVAVDDDADGLRIWIAGDTEHYPEMAQLSQWAAGPVDIALVPVGGWGPRLSEGHLDPIKAARVCAEVGVRVAIPVHWGTLHAPGWQNRPRGWMDHAGSAFAAAVAREAPHTTAVVLGLGQAWRSDRQPRSMDPSNTCSVGVVSGIAV